MKTFPGPKLQMEFCYFCKKVCFSLVFVFVLSILVYICIIGSPIGVLKGIYIYIYIYLLRPVHKRPASQSTSVQQASPQASNCT